MNRPSLTTSTTAGIPVMVKSATSESADRLRHEAEMLTYARHPGVVELIDTTDSGDTVELHLAHVVGRNLLDQPPLAPLQLASVLGEVTRTLADLHSMGVVHSNIGAEHIILDRHQHATICGFGNSTRTIAEDHEDGTDPASDIVSIGRLLDHELDRSLTSGTANDREPAVIGLRHVADLADSASVDGHGITMEDIAHRLHQLAGSTRSRAMQQVAGDDRIPLIDRLRITNSATAPLVAGVAIVTLVICFAWIARSTFGRTQVDTTPSTALGASRVSLLAETPDHPTAITGQTTSPARPTPTLLQRAVAPSCPTWGAEFSNWADVDGDGCDEPWWRVGSVLAVGDDRFSIGSPDDFVVLGDWDCNGTATPALVDKISGSVFLFDSWARDGGSETATASRTVDSALSVTVTSVAACDVLTVETPAGIVTINGAST